MSKGWIWVLLSTSQPYTVSGKVLRVVASLFQRFCEGIYPEFLLCMKLQATVTFFSLLSPRLDQIFRQFREWFLQREKGVYLEWFTQETHSGETSSGYQGDIWLCQMSHVGCIAVKSQKALKTSAGSTRVKFGHWNVFSSSCLNIPIISMTFAWTVPKWLIWRTKFEPRHEWYSGTGLSWVQARIHTSVCKVYPTFLSPLRV